MVGEELITMLGISLVAGVGRGIRGFIKHKKKDKSKFDYKKFLISVGGVAGLTVFINVLAGYLGIGQEDAVFLAGSIAASWGLTDIAEDLNK